MSKFSDIDAYNLKEILEDKFGNVINVRSYSGRGMYGKECLAFTVDEDQNKFAVVAEITEHLFELYLNDKIEFSGPDVFSKTCQDNMGLGTVLYFPGIPYVDEKPEEESE